MYSRVNISFAFSDKRVTGMWSDAWREYNVSEL